MSRPPEGRRRGQRGSAIVDFALIMLILVPLFLGILQASLVLFVKNTLTAAASEGARYGATTEHSPGDGAGRTKQLVAGTFSGKFAGNPNSAVETIDGSRMVVVRVRAKVPPLGMFGPSVTVTAEGHAVQEPR